MEPARDARGPRRAGLEDVAAFAAGFVGLAAVQALRCASHGMRRALEAGPVELWLTPAQETRARARQLHARGGDAWQARVGIGESAALRGRVVSGLECAAVEQVHGDGSTSTIIPRSLGNLSLARMPAWDADAPEPRVVKLRLDFASLVSAAQLAALWQRFPRLETLHLAQATISQLAHLGTVAPQLRELALYGLRDDVSTARAVGVMGWLTEMAELRTLRIRCQSELARLPRLTGLALVQHLDVLELCNCGRDVLESLAEIGRRGRLKELVLNVAHGDWTCAAGALAQFAHLQRLDLAVAASAIDLDFLTTFTQLKSLTLRDVKLLSFGPGTSSLESICVRGELVTPSSMASFSTFVDQCEGLRVIDLEIWAAEGHPRELLERRRWPRDLRKFHVSLLGLRMAPHTHYAALEEPPGAIRQYAAPVIDGNGSARRRRQRSGSRRYERELVSLQSLAKVCDVRVSVPAGAWTVETLPAGMGEGRCESLALQGVGLSAPDMSNLVRSLVHLRTLQVAVCEVFEAGVLANVPCLHRLCLAFQTRPDDSDDEIMCSFPLLPYLAHLEIVDYKGQSLRSLEVLAPAAALRSLTVRPAKRLEQPPRLADFRGLERLSLGECRAISSLAWTHRAGKCGLRTVELRVCSGLTTISTPCFRNVHSLVLTGCSKLSDFEPVARAKRCQTLDLSANSGLTSFPVFEGPCELRRVTIRSGVRLMDISGLAACASTLMVLDVKRCMQLRSIEILRSCPHLRELYLTKCTSVHDVSPLSDCPELEIVDLSWCAKLSKLFVMRHHYAMRKLYIRGLTQLPPIELAKVRWLPIALEELRIDGTPEHGFDFQRDSLAYTVVTSS